MRRPIAVVEAGAFTRSAERYLNESEVDELKEYLAYNPEAGDLIVGTGGARKLRWGAQGRGKRGGGRVIYYFHSVKMPLVLMDFYAKSAKHDLTDLEKKAFRAIIESAVRDYS